MFQQATSESAVCHLKAVQVFWANLKGNCLSAMLHLLLI